LERLQDWPEDALLRLQLTLDQVDISNLGYPTGLLLNGLHAVVRLLHYGSAVTHTRRTGWLANKAAQSANDAALRLQELQKAQSSGTSLSRLVCAVSLSSGNELISRKKTGYFIVTPPYPALMRQCSHVVPL